MFLRYGGKLPPSYMALQYHDDGEDSYRDFGFMTPSFLVTSRSYTALAYTRSDVPWFLK
jgi:hypothetical protein